MNHSQPVTRHDTPGAIKDLSSLHLEHLRAYMSEIIDFYMSVLRDRTHGLQQALTAAQLADESIARYFHKILVPEIQKDLEHTQRSLGRTPFEDEPND